MNKKIIGILVCMLLIMAVFPVKETAEGDKIEAVDNTADKGCKSLIVTLKCAPYTFIDSSEGKTEIKMDGFGYILEPGCPKLPSKTFLAGIPPGGEVASVELLSLECKEIPGSYDIVPAPAFSNGVDKVDYEVNKKIYSSSDSYPSCPYEYLGGGQIRKYSFAKIRFCPITYIPLTGELIVYKEIKLRVNYMVVKEISTELLSDTVMDEYASEIIVNYPSIQQLYTPPSASSMSETYDYVIITTSELENAVGLFEMWKEYTGYSVNVVTIDWISSNYDGDDLPEKIRNFLKDNYALWGTKYVLIVGSHDAIPMRYCYPDKDNHGSGGRTPTDYYYADLTGHWDSDGDGFYGERYDDNVDFHAEVLVGRIPIDTPGVVEDICQKTIDFEQDSGEWKKNALLLGAIQNFRNEDNENKKRTDGAFLMEKLRSNVYTSNGFSSTAMYEKEGLDPSNFNCDFPLTYDNVKSYWSNGYGIVTWWAHGSSTSASRKIWTNDDGDNVAEGNEISSPEFISSSDITALNDDKPSIVFSCSCNNAYPENSRNLGKSLLENGAVAFVGSTRISWYTSGWNDVSDGGNAAITYYFFKNLINSDQTCAKALYNSKEHYLSKYDWWEWHIYQNMYDFCLYGDPSVSLTTFPTPPAPDTPSIPLGPDMGRPITKYLFSTSTTHPDNLQTYFKWDWNDGSQSDWLGPFDSGGVAEVDHEWSQPGEYGIKVKAKVFSSESDWSDSTVITIWNNAPNVPTITGPTSGKAGTEYEYTFVTTDPDVDNVSLCISWGDSSEWVGPFESGEEITIPHAWNEKGTYEIKAFAKDVFNGQSDWGTLKVSMPINKMNGSFLSKFLEEYSYLFPILRFVWEYRGKKV